MKKLLVVLVSSLLASSAFAADMDLKLCDANGSKYELQIKDNQVTLHQFAPDTSDMTLTKTLEDPFKPGGLGEGEQIALTIAGLKDYQDGIYYEAVGSDHITYPIIVFNYGKNEKSVLMVVGDWPMPIGKTEGCQ